MGVDILLQIVKKGVSIFILYYDTLMLVGLVRRSITVGSLCKDTYNLYKFLLNDI